MNRDVLCLVTSALITTVFAAAPGCGGDDPAETTSTSAAGGQGGASTGVTVSAGGSGEGGSVATSTSSSSSGGGLPFSSEGGDTDYEAEGHVAADGKGNVVVCWLGFSTFDSVVGYSVSHDDGETWTEPRTMHAPGNSLSSAPVVAVTGDGTFFLSFAGFTTDPSAPDEHVYLSELDPATDTFGAPTIASDDGTKTNLDFDKPWLTVDALDDKLLTWADFSGFNQNVPPSLTFARSNDGLSFSKTTIVSDATFGNLAYPCLDRNQGAFAPLYVVHLGQNGTLVLRKSTDGGLGFSSSDVPVTSVLFQDPRCVVSGSDVWITYAYGTALFSPSESPPADEIRMIHSGDGGQSFDAPVTVSNGAASVQYLFPQLVRTASGKLEVTYYQGSKGQAGQVMRASSSDGVSFSVSTVAQAGSFTVDRTTPDWLGDYTGLAAAAGKLYLAFGSNAGGATHIQFAKQ